MLGGIYALLGIGLTLIFGIMRVVNFTHGELYSFGAYMMFMFVMLLASQFLSVPGASHGVWRRAGRGDRVSPAA